MTNAQQLLNTLQNDYITKTKSDSTTRSFLLSSKTPPSYLKTLTSCYNYKASNGAKIRSKKDLVIIEIPKNSKAKILLECNLKNTCNQRVLIKAMKNSKSTVLEIQNSKHTCTFQSHEVKIIAMKNAQVNYTQLQNLNHNTEQITNKKATLEKNSKVSINEFTFGSKSTKSKIKIELNNYKAQSQVNTLAFTNAEQTMNFEVTTTHNASETTSNANFKAALLNSSKIAYKNSIVIPKNSKDCTGSQKHECLLLSSKASSSAVPILEIASNEIKCSHSSSTTNLNPKKIYYLQSRGLSAEDAKMQVVKSFYASMLNQTLELENNIKTEIERLIEEKLQK